MVTIAYLGPEHTNTHLAAQAHFGRKAEYAHAPTVEDVFRLVEREEAEFGVVPIENSLEGAVTHTLDRFVDFKQSPVRIHGEIERHIRHHLITHPGVKLPHVTVVFSHPQALAQCRRWLDRHAPQARRWETNSTAEAVDYLMRRQPLRRVNERGVAEEFGRDLRERAAIARGELAKSRKLDAMPIPEQHENKTRFLVLGLGEAPRGRRNKTSILFALKDRPGALYDALTPFKRQGINLTKIESRPSKKKAWEYYFFIDLEGHQHEARVTRALKALERRTDVLQVLGSYPISNHP